MLYRLCLGFALVLVSLVILSGCDSKPVTVTPKENTTPPPSEVSKKKEGPKPKAPEKKEDKPAPPM